MLQSYKHFFNLPPHLLNCVKTSGFIGIFCWLSTLFMWLNLNRFEQIVAMDNLTKLHLSMSKSWLTPDYYFLRKSLEKNSTESFSINGLRLSINQASLMFCIRLAPLVME